jgi:ATP-binding protein involved in chromosome partitioning
VQVPILGLVENMSMFVCANCGHEHPIFGHGGARATAEAMAMPFLGEIPLVLKIRELSDKGTPISVTEPESPEAAAFAGIAKKVATALQTTQRNAPKIVLE